jgi:hypothetical protein
MRQFTLDGGGHGRLELFDGERVVVRTSRSSPPGSTLVARFADFDEPLGLKVKSCRSDRESGEYRIEARAVNLTRAMRERLGRI